MVSMNSSPIKHMDEGTPGNALIVGMDAAGGIKVN